MNVIIFGPPGAGKGTQANNIVKKFNLYQVSTGDLLREEVKNQTQIGKDIENIISKGDFATDEIVNELIKNNDYLLLHGQNDTIVPISKMYNAVEQLEPFAKTLNKKIYNDLEHSINEEGIIEGLNFIKERM